MSFKRNKKDFESALEAMRCNFEVLEGCLDDDVMHTLRDVIHEYEGHYEPDIQQMIDYFEAIKDIKDKLCI